jgi:triphosphoribosyl-dephospho-CoA synthase
MKALTREPSGADRVPVFPDAAGVAALAQLACLLEASAPKPGNVSPGRHFADTRYEHFLASAAAIGGPLASVGDRSLGAAIRLAIESTSRFTSANTNLGIVLLLMPLARAAVVAAGSGSDPADSAIRGLTPIAAPSGVGAIPGVDSRSLQWGDSRRQELRTNVRQVLGATTVDDARDVYAAIRMASPGGLGEVETEDVAGEPTQTLLEVMQLAAHRDGIAREYATGFATTFETGTPALIRARHDGLSWDDAVVETFLTLLAEAPDTHIVRRGGAELADGVTQRAAAVLAAGGVRSNDGRRAIAEMDAALRGPRNTANPGTTADLTAATIFVFLLAGGWHAEGQ